MKTLRTIIVFGALALLMYACNPTQGGEEPVTEEKEARPVEVMTLSKDSVDRSLEYTANLTAFEELHYAPAQPGRIDKIFVEAGDRVRKGQQLVKMEETQLHQAMLQLEDARTNYERLDTLYKLNSISKQQYDQAKMAYELAESNLNYLQDNTTLVAPFNGVVTNKYFEAGELYSGAPNTAVGKAAVLTLMQINPLKAVVSISERFFPDIKQGMKAQVYSDVYPTEKFNGTIHKVYPTIDPMTRTFKVEVRVDNPQEKLRPGMFARVEVIIANEPALLVPAISIVKQEGTNNRHVFVYEDGQARKIEVGIGKRFDELVEVNAPELQPGMQLIVAGQAKLMDGDAVRTVR